MVWRGWFYTNDHVDISLDQVKWFKINTENPEIENTILKNKKEQSEVYISDIRNLAAIPNTVSEIDSASVDFYTYYDPFSTNVLDIEDYYYYIEGLDGEERELLLSNRNYYELQFSNHGGLVMPIILEFEYISGEKEEIRIPAEIWKKNTEKISKVFILDKELSSVTLDPFLETADVNRNNNYWPPRLEPTRFQLYKQSTITNENLMQRNNRANLKTIENED